MAVFLSAFRFSTLKSVYSVYTVAYTCCNADWLHVVYVG